MVAKVLTTFGGIAVPIGVFGVASFQPVPGEIDGFFRQTRT
jgi:hypothetical protein